MTVVGNSVAPSSYKTWQTVESLAFSPYQQGGVENVLIATFDFEDTSAKTLFTLPKGAVVTQTQVDITTAFTAGSGNTFDIGLGSTADALVDGAASGTIARLIPVQDVPSIVPLTAATNVTATYIPSGTPANAGAATVYVRYVVLGAS